MFPIVCFLTNVVAILIQAIGVGWLFPLGAISFWLVFSKYSFLLPSLFYHRNPQVPGCLKRLYPLFTAAFCVCNSLPEDLWGNTYLAFFIQALPQILTCSASSPQLLGPAWQKSKNIFNFLFLPCLSLSVLTSSHCLTSTVRLLGQEPVCPLIMLESTVDVDGAVQSSSRHFLSDYIRRYINSTN